MGDLVHIVRLRIQWGYLFAGQVHPCESSYEALDRSKEGYPLMVRRVINGKIYNWEHFRKGVLRAC